MKQHTPSAEFLLLAILLMIVQTSGTAHAQLPESFDLRDVGGESYVSSVRTQPWGTCWAHGSMAAIEGNLMITGVWESAGESGEPDMSENHLDWWNGFNDFNNDDIDPPNGGGLTVHYGGDYMVTSAYLARGEGAVREIDGQGSYIPPERSDSSFHFYYVRDIEWFVAGEDLSNIDIIKQRLMDEGVIATAMTTWGDYMENCIHYQPMESTTEVTHAVAIVGWDDNLVTQAPQSGAWLCKNSWGTHWCNDGYFWISYYDKYCCQQPEMGAVSFRNIEPMAYDYVYYHDYHGWRDSISECSAAFNAFTATGQHEVQSVSFFTTVDNVFYTVKIFDRFEGGELLDELAAQTGFIEYRGFHTIDLPGAVQLVPGDQFFVYLELSGGGYAFDRTSIVPILLGADYRTLVESSANPGESFYRSGSEWHDLYNDDNTANFCIKALAVENTSISVSLADGPPDVIEQHVPNEIIVEIVDGNESYVTGTGTLHYRFDGGTYETSPLTHLSENTYVATIPPVRCDQTPEFYISAQSNGGTTIYSPFDAPSGTYTASVGTYTIELDDNFETDQGWAVSPYGATAGFWERGIPIVDPGYPYSPRADSDGSGCCYLTGNDYGDSSDVDDGSVWLTSPVFSMSDGWGISYDYYVYLEDIGGDDGLLVEVNNAGGVGDWVVLEQYTTSCSFIWRNNTITSQELAWAGVPVSSTMRIRFNVTDGFPDDIVEAGIDAVRVYKLECESDLPAVPTLLTPFDGESTYDNTPEFTWSATAGPGGSYTLEYSQDIAFASGVQTLPGLTGEQYTPDIGQELDNGIWYWHVRATNSIGYTSDYQETAFSFVVNAWLCGDADASGAVDIDDVVYLICFIFSGGLEPVPYESGDVNCSGGVDIDDVVWLINYIFTGGYAPCDTDGDEVPDC